MSAGARHASYTARVALRSRVITYVTGDRAGMQSQISNDVIDLIGDHLDSR